MTLYRKYRPQKLSELDNTEVRERLTRVFSSSFTPHALLFSGPKGTGKTSAARIVAKVLNCEKHSTYSSSKEATATASSSSRQARTISDSNIEPCNKCETCSSITQGNNLDVLEIDAASNRGIDEIRDLRDKIKLAPGSVLYKVYIIDEAHMLTTEAFNALLKTLEEPPAHAVFILATTEPERLPATITSRCIIFDFKKASDSEIVHCLNRVVDGEKVRISEELLDKIAQAADGSFRDATKILEQAILENALSEDKLNLLLGRDTVTSEKFLTLLTSKDATQVLSAIDKMTRSGVNIRFLVEDILRILHQILLIRHQVGNNKLNPDLVNTFQVKELLMLIKLFSRVYVELKNTNMPYLPLEVAAVEWCEES